MHSETRRGAFMALGLATAWALLVIAVPVTFAAQGHGTERGAWSTGLATVTYLAGGVICHQQPARSFSLRGTQLPVCARCAGLYLAAPFGLVWGVGTSAGWKGRTFGSVARVRGGWRPVQIALAVTALPTAATWGAEVVGLLSSSNGVRAVAAIPLGFSIAATVGLALCVPRRAYAVHPPRA